MLPGNAWAAHPMDPCMPEECIVMLGKSFAEVNTKKASANKIKTLVSLI